MTDLEIEIGVLEDKVTFIDRRLAELEPLIARLPAGDYARQELLDELSTFGAARRVAERRLKELTGADAPEERARREKALARTEALRAARVRSHRAACFETAEQFEKQGDFRNAKLQRIEALNARQVAEAEIQ
jgi:hypothetical protein